ncbi:unnamed protein product [Vicia faba]|uniref:Uncharacterized protein n=1 Tax=Vicia faba TaxID=3906 RepID=A0AAV1A658_VICFA|nr:unnamed protein product [Vicia faba]
MRDIDSYNAEDDVEPNVGPSDKTSGEPSGPHTKSTPTLEDVPILDNFINDILDRNDVALDSLSEEERQMKRIKPQEKKCKDEKVDELLSKLTKEEDYDIEKDEEDTGNGE